MRMRRLSLAPVATLLGAALAHGCTATPLDAIGLVPEAAAPDAATTTPDLVAHWSFDEGSGTIAHDDSGNRYHGHLVGGKWVADGRFGGAVRLDLGNYIAVNGFQDATLGWTISAWVRLTGADLAGLWGSILSTEIMSVGGWQLYVDPSDSSFHSDYVATSGAGGVDTFACCAPVGPDRWYHLTVVVAGDARTMTFYEGTQLQVTSAMLATILPGDPTLYMGTWNASAGQPPGQLAGTIDDVSIWARALGPDEIVRLDESAVASAP